MLDGDASISTQYNQSKKKSMLYTTRNGAIYLKQVCFHAKELVSDDT